MLDANFSFLFLLLVLWVINFCLLHFLQVCSPINNLMPKSFGAKPKGLNSWQPKASCHEDRNSCWTDGLLLKQPRSHKRKPITTQAETFMTFGDKRVSAVYVCISSDNQIFALPVFTSYSTSSIPQWECEEERGDELCEQTFGILG